MASLMWLKVAAGCWLKVWVGLLARGPGSPSGPLYLVALISLQDGSWILGGVYSKCIGGSGRSLKAKSWKLYSDTSATFCWSEQVTGPAQIQKEGNRLHLLMRDVVKNL